MAIPFFNLEGYLAFGQRCRNFWTGGESEATVWSFAIDFADAIAASTHAPASDAAIVAGAQTFEQHLKNGSA